VAKASIQITTALSAAVGIPLTITIYPPMTIPLAIGVVIAAVIVTLHLKLGGRAFIRKSPKGTITFVLDPGRRPAPPRTRT